MFADRILRGVPTLGADIDDGLAGLPTMPEEIPTSLGERIRVELGERNLTMAAVSGTFNMIHPNPRKRRDGLRRLGVLAEEVLDAAFELLGEDVVIARAKDVKNTGAVVAAGRGELDYDWYLENLRGFGFEGPLILHNLEEGEVEGSVSFLRTKLGENAACSEQRGS